MIFFVPLSIVEGGRAVGGRDSRSWVGAVNFEKNIYSMMLVLSVAIHSVLMEILIS